MQRQNGRGICGRAEGVGVDRGPAAEEHIAGRRGKAHTRSDVSLYRVRISGELREVKRRPSLAARFCWNSSAHSAVEGFKPRMPDGDYRDGTANAPNWLGESCRSGANSMPVLKSS